MENSNLLKSARWNCATLLTLCSAVFSLQAGATLLLYDGFAAGGEFPGAGQYQSSPASTNGSNNDSLFGQSPELTGFDGGNDWGGVPVNNFAATVYPRVNNTGLTYQDLVTTPGSVEIFRDGSTSGDSFKRISRNTEPDSIGDGGDPERFFMSALYRFTPGNEGYIRIDTIGPGDAPDRNHSIGFNSSGQFTTLTDGTPDGATAGIFNAGATHMVVVEYIDPGFGAPDPREVNFWINPVDLTDPNAGAEATGTFATNWAAGNIFGSLTLIAQTGDGLENPSFEFDEIRIGHSWDVVTPIPEPGSLVLLGIALGSLWVFRRRNR